MTWNFHTLFGNIRCIYRWNFNSFRLYLSELQNFENLVFVNFYSCLFHRVALPKRGHLLCFIKWLFKRSCFVVCCLVTLHKYEQIINFWNTIVKSIYNQYCNIRGTHITECIGRKIINFYRMINTNSWNLKINIYCYIIWH